MFQEQMCLACAAGLPGECENPKSVEGEPEWIIPCSVEFETVAVKVPAKGQVGRPMLDPADVTDPKSTGRKRAKMLAPILTGQLCQWSGLKHAGGGVVPIVGCSGNQIIDLKGGDKDQGYLQGDRHHGPDKNTLNNSVGVNLHSICVACHHRWHSVNDPYYDKEGRPEAEFAFTPTVPYYLHDPVTASTEEDYLLAESWWEEAVFDRGPYPIQPADTTRMALPIPQGSATLEDEDNPYPEASPFTDNGETE